MSNRRRPLKLHVKEGKDSRFLLIGPKGREIQDLVWDGAMLTLEAVSASDEVSGPNEKEGGEQSDVQTDTSELDLDMPAVDENPGPAGQDFPATGMEPIPSDMSAPEKIEAKKEVDMISGDTEVPDKDDIAKEAVETLPDLPTPSDEPGQDGTEQPTDVPTSDAFDLEDEKKKKGLVHDSDNPDPEKKPIAYIDESTDDKIVITRVIPKGDGDDAEPDNKAKDRVMEDAKKRTPDAKFIDKGQATKLLGHDPDIKGKGDKVEVDKPKDEDSDQKKDEDKEKDQD